MIQWLILIAVRAGTYYFYLSVNKQATLFLHLFVSVSVRLKSSFRLFDDDFSCYLSGNYAA